MYQVQTNQGNKMKHEKQYYMDLPVINGFQWSYYDEGFHCFTKKVGSGWKQSHVKEDDITDGFYVNILQFGLSRK